MKKRPGFYTLAFYILIIQDLNKILKNLEHPFEDTIK